MDGSLDQAQPRVAGTQEMTDAMSLNKWADDNSMTIGNTPLVKLKRVTKGCEATVLAKIEGAPGLCGRCGAVADQGCMSHRTSPGVGFPRGGGGGWEPLGH